MRASVDHGKLIEELHRVQEGAVKGEAADAHEAEPQKGDKESPLQALSVHAVAAENGQRDEAQVADGIP